MKEIVPKSRVYTRDFCIYSYPLLWLDLCQAVDILILVPHNTVLVIGPSIKMKKMCHAWCYASGFQTCAGNGTNLKRLLKQSVQEKASQQVVEQIQEMLELCPV